MAKNNLNILFWLYRARINKEGEVPIYLRITYGNIRKNLASGFTIQQERWDSSKGKVKGKKDDALLINKYISQTVTRLIDLFNEMHREGDINLDVLIDQFWGKKDDNRTLIELVEFHNKDFYSRIGTDYAKSTYEKYDILYRKLLNFIPYKYHKKDIRLKDLSITFITDFDFYLKNHENNEHNTATKYLKNLKKILSLGGRNGWIKTNPFEHFKSVYKDVDRVYLTQYELEIIQRKDISLGRLNQVRDLFLFQCYTGLAYSDMAKLSFGNIVPGINGVKWIITRRKKTNVRAAIPLLIEAEEIIMKYNNGIIEPSKPLFDFYSIQKFNSYLHEIADLCGIDKNLTSHVGRRTFATTIALANGIGLETISKILGHSNTKITAQYAVVTDIKVGQDMADLQRRLLDQKSMYTPNTNLNISST